MDSNAGVISNSLIEFGQQGDYHTHAMTEAKEAAGFAPLETLPAEWYNNYLYKLDQHINRLQVLVRQLQQEVCNTVTATGATPSDTTLTQLNTAINKKIEDNKPLIATGSTAGLVKSSATRGNVAVAADGVMSVNGFDDVATSSAVGMVKSKSQVKNGYVEVDSDGLMQVTSLKDWGSTSTVQTVLTHMPTQVYHGAITFSGESGAQITLSRPLQTYETLEIILSLRTADTDTWVGPPSILKLDYLNLSCAQTGYGYSLSDDAYYVYAVRASNTTVKIFASEYMMPTHTYSITVNVHRTLTNIASDYSDVTVSIAATTDYAIGPIIAYTYITLIDGFSSMSQLPTVGTGDSFILDTSNTSILITLSQELQSNQALELFVTPETLATNASTSISTPAHAWIVGSASAIYVLTPGYVYYTATTANSTMTISIGQVSYKQYAIFRSAQYSQSFSVSYRLHTGYGQATPTVSLSIGTVSTSISQVKSLIYRRRFIPQNATYATYAQYLVNSTSPSGTNYVTADTSRNLTAHTVTLT